LPNPEGVNVTVGNKGKKLCDKCRHYVSKKNLRGRGRGRICVTCYAEYYATREKKKDDRNKT